MPLDRIAERVYSRVEEKMVNGFSRFCIPLGRFCLTTATLVEAKTGFHAFSLSPSVLAAVQRASSSEPTPIQAAFIPKALAGHDIIGQAQTGTGKTAAFLLPFLSNWRDTNEPGPQLLVMVPTRELVVQVAEEA